MKIIIDAMNKNHRIILLYTIYQIAELLACLVFLCLNCHANATSPNVGDEVDIAFIVYDFIPYAIGVGIQYVLVVLTFMICVKFGFDYLSKIKVVTYLSIDVVFPIALPIFMIVMFGLYPYVIWMLYFAIFIVCSKFLFFRYIRWQYCPKKSLSTSAQHHGKDYVSGICQIGEVFPKRFDEKEIDYIASDSFINDDNLLYYEDMNYSIYKTTTDVIMSVVFKDKSGMYCRYFVLNESDIAIGYEKLFSLADDIRSHTKLYKTREIVSTDSGQRDENEL